jgi:hypothetical protein
MTATTNNHAIFARDEEWRSARKGANTGGLQSVLWNNASVVTELFAESYLVSNRERACLNQTKPENLTPYFNKFPANECGKYEEDRPRRFIKMF